MASSSDSRRGSTRLVASLVLIALVAHPLAPAIITVVGGCNLAAAIQAANADAPSGGCPAGQGDDTIVLTGDVPLTAVAEVGFQGDNGLPTVTSTITIDGRGHEIERTSALADFRILTVAGTGDLTLQNTTVSGGRVPGGGGAFFVDGGSMTIAGSALTSNRAVQLGGAVYSTGTLIVRDSLFQSNTVGQNDEEVGFGGAIWAIGGTLEVERTTFSGNAVGGLFAKPDLGAGGAIFSYGATTVTESTFVRNNVVAFVELGSAIFVSSNQLALTNSTVSGNGFGSTTAAAVEASSAVLSHVTFSGNYVHALASYSSGGAISATATILANTDGGTNCAGNVTGLNSVADDSSCGSIPSGLTGLDPVLSDNGGPTTTHALLAGSNAIEAAGFCSVSADQRGAPRVGACDIGAFEYLGCPVFALDTRVIADAETYEECAIEAGPDVAVVGPSGALTLRFGQSVTIKDGFAVESGAALAIERDPALMLVLPELVEADRARRRAGAATRPRG